MKNHSFTVVALVALLALTSWAASNLAADAPDAGQQEVAALQVQVTQLQERVQRLESRVDELSQPKLHPVEGR